MFGDAPNFQNDPHFRDHVLFYEYFHGDSGRGVGASHQTGWTGVIAKLLQPRRPEPGQPEREDRVREIIKYSARDSRHCDPLPGL